jgi:hypothetical protein
VNDKPQTGLRRPSSVTNLRAAAAAPAPLAAGPPPPEEQPRPAKKKYPERIPLNVDDEMRRALEQARVNDRVETTARIRAMIHLWQEDETFRARVNELAPDFRADHRGDRT